MKSRTTRSVYHLPHIWKTTITKIARAFSVELSMFFNAATRRAQPLQVVLTWAICLRHPPFPPLTYSISFELGRMVVFFPAYYSMTRDVHLLSATQQSALTSRICFPWSWRSRSSHSFDEEFNCQYVHGETLQASSAPSLSPTSPICFLLSSLVITYQTNNF